MLQSYFQKQSEVYQHVAFNIGGHPTNSQLRKIKI